MHDARDGPKQRLACEIDSNLLFQSKPIAADRKRLLPATSATVSPQTAAGPIRAEAGFSSGRNPPDAKFPSLHQFSRGFSRKSFAGYAALRFT
jgi:hypothetical protein